MKNITVLDRYILRKFIINLLISAGAFIIIFLVVDLIENIDKFIDRQAEITLVFIYYLYYIPYIINLTLPISMLLSCLFTLGNMSQHNEIVAQKSAGISRFAQLIFKTRILRCSRTTCTKSAMILAS